MKTAERLTDLKLMKSVDRQVELLLLVFHEDTFAIFIVSKVCQLNLEEILCLEEILYLK